jgi:ABC-type phosphate transport system substrate-binding protein
VEDHLGRIVGRVAALLLTLAVLLPVRTDGQGTTVLVVTGSSMPEPLYLLWNDEYHKQQPAVQVR